MRLNLIRNVLKDYLVVKFYLRLHRRVKNWKWVQGLESDNTRFFVSSIFASTWASMIFPLLLTPLDVAKTKTFCEIGPQSASQYTKLMLSLRNVTLRDGFRGLWRGTGLSSLYSFSHSLSLLTASHFLSLTPSLDFSNFFFLNTVISTICYPFDTIM